VAAPARGLAALTDALKGRLLDALLGADRRAAEAVIDDALSEGMDGLAVLDELLTPVMHAVGRLWESGEITIADEHLATAVAHGTLTRIYPELATAEPRTRGVVLLAGADGEQHMFGLRMLADVLEAAGFDVRNVAGSLPPESLAASTWLQRDGIAIDAHTAVCLSARQGLAAAERLTGN
jgi:methanogenic corrinoid protein MtbC1